MTAASHETLSTRGSESESEPLCDRRRRGLERYSGANNVSDSDLDVVEQYAATIDTTSFESELSAILTT